jgi:hypothetical protein
MKSEEKFAEFQLEDIQEKDGDYYFTAISLTEDFEKKPCRERLAKDSVNKHLIWRHRHPLDDAHNHAHIFGTVTNSKATDDAIKSEYKPYTHTELHKEFIEEIKEKKAAGDPIGISMRYRKYYDESGQITHLDVFEHSLTPFPKCEECLVIDDYIGEKEVPDKKDKKDEEQGQEPVMEDELEKHLKKIDELEKSLNSKTEALEGYKTKLETLEKDLKEAVETKDQEEKTLEDRVKTLEEKLESQKEDYEKKIDFLKKEPTLNEMFEMRKLDEDEKEFYKNLSLEKLIKKKAEWSEERIKPTTKTMEASADDAQDVKNEDEEKKDKPLTEEQINEFVKDERMRSIMLKQIKKEGKEE